MAQKLRFVISDMGRSKGGHLLRLEPDRIELFEALPEIKEKFVQAHWYQFCSAFQGIHTEVAMTFAKNFDGYQTQVGNLIIHISEHSISTAFNLPIDGERWFKKKEILGNFCNQFLTKDHQNPEWSKGIPNTWLKEEW